MALALPLVLALLTTPAQADDDHWVLADAGWGVKLPAGWDVPSGGWSDWALKAKHRDGSVLQIWVTPFQVPVTKDNVAAWAKMYEDQIAAEAKADVRVVSQEVIDLGGRKTGHVTLKVVVKGGKGVAEVYAVEGTGHTVHARVVTGERKAKVATKALRALVESVRIDQTPYPTKSGTIASEKGGFEVTLPDEWRAPLQAEDDEIAKIVGAIGIEEIDRTTCVVGVRPRAVDNPDVTLLCPTPLHLDPLDEYSFEGIEAQLHERFFGRAKAEVPTGEAVTIGDRMGVYFRPPAATGAFRLAIAPYDQGMLTWWGVGGGKATDPERGSDLDASLMKMQAEVTFTGPNAGAPIIRADRWISYYLSYRPTSPMVLGPLVALVGMIGGAIALARRRKPSYEDID